MRRLAALVAILALAAPGCASSDHKLHRELRSERMATMTIITRAEVAAQPPGSPSRAVLEAWRAVQFRNVEGALERVSPQPKPDQVKSFENFVVAIGAQAAATIKPKIVDLAVHGRRAVVVVDFARHKRVGDQIRSTVVGRVRVQLIRGRSGWLVLWQKAADQIVKVVV